MSTVHDVDEVLDVLREEERSLSLKRTRLHGRIDFLHSGGYAHLDAATEMSRLRDLERDLSIRRKELHAQIDVARRERQRRCDASA